MSYTARFRAPLFWLLVGVVVVDLVVVFVPVLSVALVAVLLMPEGWRELERLAAAVRRIQTH